MTNQEIQTLLEMLDKEDLEYLQYNLSYYYEQYLNEMRAINNMQKQEIEAVYERIKKDDICVAGLIGNNGRISDEELQKIHTANIDKMRKLV